MCNISIKITDKKSTQIHNNSTLSIQHAAGTPAPHIDFPKEIPENSKVEIDVCKCDAFNKDPLHSPNLSFNFLKRVNHNTTMLIDGNINVFAEIGNNVSITTQYKFMYLGPESHESIGKDVQIAANSFIIKYNQLKNIKLSGQSIFLLADIGHSVLLDQFDQIHVAGSILGQAELSAHDSITVTKNIDHRSAHLKADSITIENNLWSGHIDSQNVAVSGHIGEHAFINARLLTCSGIFSNNAKLSPTLKMIREFFINTDADSLMRTLRKVIEMGDIIYLKKILAINPELVNGIIDMIVPVNEFIPLGVTPLIVAVDRGHTSLIKELIAAGANVNLVTVFGIRPIDVAARSGCVEHLKVLVDAGAKIEKQDIGWINSSQPLHYAAIYGQQDALDFLITNGATINAIDSFGFTALYYAIDTGHLSCVMKLLSNGADPNAENSFFKLTPLHAAAKRGCSKSLKLLLKFGAEAHKKDNDGKTPLDFAKNYEHKQCIELLGKNAEAESPVTPLFFQRNRASPEMDSHNTFHHRHSK